VELAPVSELHTAVASVLTRLVADPAAAKETGWTEIDPPPPFSLTA
jgi:hypothetical protein